MKNYTYSDHDMLLLRLQNAIKKGKKLSVLVGSGLTMPNKDTEKLGVSSVKDIVEEIKQIFLNNKQLEKYESRVNESMTDSEKYQSSMQTLLAGFGQEELNKVINHAVLNCLVHKPILSTNQDEQLSEMLEKKVEDWYIPKGCDALGQIFVDFGEHFTPVILTSNFDPMLEISIRRHNGNPLSIFLVNDGKFLNQKSDNSQCIVHFHGYWHGTDTLHTVDQLNKERPQLKGDLKNLLQNSILLVVGYGGWNDVFTNTLLEVIKEGNNNFEVLWCFYSNNEDKIESDNGILLSSMYSSIGQRVVLYKDIDCNKLFPDLLLSLDPTNQNIELKQELKLDVLSNVEIDLGTFSAKEIKQLLNEKNDNTELLNCDMPPHNLFWVGREDELKLLVEGNFKTCFITGFGGQGKSGLASQYVNYKFHQTKYSLWDWRDCKEEDNKFQTILIAQIERISNAKYRAINLVNETNQDLISLFFEVLDNKAIVFIYDNVDHYIDLEVFNPIGGLGRLFEEANERNHNSQFIFTCRPHIKDSSSNFLEISLKELSLVDTEQLFKEYKTPISLDKVAILAKEAHSLTNGHALWLSLIAAQAKRGLQIVESFLQDYKVSKELRNNDVSISLAERTLDVVWKSLNKKQQILLRGMSEMVTAFSQDEIEKILISELSLNQFNKSFHTLNSLNLLVVKSSTGQESLFELHPLVKEYILRKYKKNERAKYITLIVNFYDQIIVLIKPKTDANSPISYFEKYTQKAELQINNGDFKGALISLHEISHVILAAGFGEEYLRVGTFLFDKINWLIAITEEYFYFNDEISWFITILVERGRFSEVEKYLEKYIEVIPGKSIQYLSFCKTNAYYHWFKGDFSTAIDWSEKGIELQKKTDVGNTLDLTNQLALSLRDTKKEESIERALYIFLKGEQISDIISNNYSNENFSSEYFGNIGRCLFFQKKYKESLAFYFKSYTLLGKEKGANTVLNTGYACLWISEVLLNETEELSAIHFLKFCLICWEKTAPIKANRIRKEYGEFLNSENSMEVLSTLTNWDVEKYCNDFVERYLTE